MKIVNLSILFVFLVFSTAASGQKMKAEDVLAKHLESIGTVELKLPSELLKLSRLQK